MRKAFIAAAALSAALGAQETLRIGAAGSLAGIGPALAKAFEASAPGVKAEFSFASTGALLTQIERGAPYDILMAADDEAPAMLAAKGLADAPATYARGRLVLFSKRARPLDPGLAALKGGGLIAIANPATAPYGKAALEAMAKAGIATEGRLVIGQSVSQAATFGLNSADFALIPYSSLFAEAFAAYRGKEGLNWVFVDRSLHDPMLHALCLLKGGKSALGRRFVEFLLRGEGAKILREAGFGGADG
jgi:molybdate transport system substrate-binding protein